MVMSRYPPPEYRGPPRDRSRSPSRFAERRPSTAALFDNRPPPPPRTASDAPRGPRSQFDGPRPPPPSRLESASGPRPAYTSLRDAPPLSGSGDRGRPYRERDYDRRDRPPSRDRSPPRGIKDARDYPPRDLDINRSRRESRDGPLSTGSNYSDAPPPGSSQFRGGFGRGRGRGEFSFRGGRGGRSNLDDRDLLRRDRQERSPPRWGARDGSRDERDLERRDDRRFDKREDDRRPSDWAERERGRDGDRFHRDQPAPRLDSRPSTESVNSLNAPYQSSQAPPINPQRLALLEKSGADPSVRRSSVQLDPPTALDARREQPETPSYLNGRAETTAKRYDSRDSSPPTQAPAVPAFSFLPPSAPSASLAPPAQRKSPQDSKPSVSPANETQQQSIKVSDDSKPEPPADAPVAPKAQLASPPPAAPRAPRAHEGDDVFSSTNRLQASRSLEGLSSQNAAPTGPGFPRPDPATQPMRPPQSPAASSALPMLIQPVSPRQPAKASELGAPTGPRASRMSPRLASVSPRPPFASPRSDAGVIQGPPSGPRTQTPPPTAPSGPRAKAFSVSPKAAPTAPKASRAPPLAPRGLERGPPAAPSRAPDRLTAPQPWAPPSAPRTYQWNQWRKPGAPGYDAKSIPAKRDFAGEEKPAGDQLSAPFEDGNSLRIKTEDGPRLTLDGSAIPSDRQTEDEMHVDRQPPRRQTSLISGHSAAQSFFGKPTDGEEEENDDTGVSDIGQEPPSTSEDDSDSEVENLTLFNAKFERQKRQLEAQSVDLSARPYRATTPLESIARLFRISTQDLQRVIEQREQEMDVDDSPVTNHNVPATTHSSDSGDGTDVVTPPRGDSHHRINIRGSDESLESIRRIRRPSPEPVSLPYLVKDGRPPFHDSDAFREGQKRYEETTEDVLDAMEEEFATQDDMDRDAEAMFADDYRRWKEDCEDLDRYREEQEKLERQQSIEPGPELDAPIMPLANPFEGRRLHKYSSEYDVEQVLKQSEETARIEQERHDREAKKNQADMEKEARVPDQMAEDEMARAVFLDVNRYRDADDLTVVFSYEPPADDFTEHEQTIFIAAFKETPKKWGEIASLFPDRTYEDCIRHYYANKWDGRFRDNRTKKLKAGGRRGRGGPRGPRGRMGGLMADLARAEDFLTPDQLSEKGRPRRAAAPTTFAEKEAEAKASLQGPSPNKKPGPMSKGDSNGDNGSDKPGKRVKRTAGEKPGRKGKTGQPLQNLVAAPQGVLGIQATGARTDIARAQKLEEASLLASLHSGHQGMISADGHVLYAPEGYMHPAQVADDAERSRPGNQAGPQRQSASSYWSVPEQQDFSKYIGHFGRDFAAIAAHMGTKTQTMIKNHFQRQIDSGTRPDLEKAANAADERRARGEDIGPPPAPTPIVKRKYENPQTAPSRPLAPHSEAMEADDHAQAARAQAKHASPPQYQPRPQFSAPPPSQQIPATRVVPSPMAATAIPASLQQMQRPLQHTLGARPSFLSEPRLSESRPESRQGPLPGPSFRAAQDSPLRGQTQQSGRTHVDAQDPQYLRNLAQEQERALRMQAQFSEDHQPQRQNSQNRHPGQGSPLNQPLHHPADRKPLGEERSGTPPRTAFPGFPRPSLGSSTFGQLGVAPPFTTFAGRSPFNPSPPKREEHRPGSVPTGPPVQTSTPAPHPEPPKRSNVMSLLNNDEEEPKPPKRDSLPSASQRVASPTSQAFPHSTSAPSIPAIRRDPSFGQPSVPGSHFGRPPFGSTGSAASVSQSSLKHDPGNVSVTQPPKQDWAVAARALQTSQPPSATPTLERDVRGYYQHNHRTSLLSGIGSSRGIPSPPPLGSGIGHSRTPSLTQTSQPGREPSRPSLAGQPGAPHSTAQALHPNPYGSQQSNPFAQQQSRESQNQSQHSHNSSIGGPFPSLHHRGISRDDQLRQDQAHAAAMRERDQREREEMRWRQDVYETERRREEEMRQRQQQLQEQERQQRGPPSAIQPPPFGGPPFGQGRGFDLRGQARFESEVAVQRHEEQSRARLQDEQMRRESMIRDREEDFRRRQEERERYRTTPLGSGLGFPPQQQQQQQQQRR